MALGTFYSGPAADFPAKETWLDFDTLFNLNKGEISASGNTNSDVSGIYNAIKEAAEYVESRVILAIIMQESSGNVGVVTTGDDDAGLMQAHGSPGFPGQHGLSQDQIVSMILAGTLHYKGNLEQLDNQDTASTIYRALRLYNSGQLDDSNLSNGLGATDSYVSDIANRLQGVTDSNGALRLQRNPSVNR